MNEKIKRDYEITVVIFWRRIELKNGPLNLLFPFQNTVSILDLRVRFG
jgi:hypothetical protein